MLLFALLISVALAALGQRRGAERFRYAVWTFALFVLVGIGVAWMMYPLSH
jgi:cell division septal protein FtsQ